MAAKPAKPATPSPSVRVKRLTPRLTAQAIEIVIAGDYAKIEACQRSSNTTALGVSVTFSVYGDGSAKPVEVSGASSVLSACLKKRVLRWRFPSHGGEPQRHRFLF